MYGANAGLRFLATDSGYHRNSGMGDKPELGMR